MHESETNTIIIPSRHCRARVARTAVCWFLCVDGKHRGCKARPFQATILQSRCCAELWNTSSYKLPNPIHEMHNAPRQDCFARKASNVVLAPSALLVDARVQKFCQAGKTATPTAISLAFEPSLAKPRLRMCHSAMRKRKHWGYQQTPTLTLVGIF